MKWYPAEDGWYYWRCKCGKRFCKNTPQGIGIARSNHLRKHGIYTMDGEIRND